MKRLAIHTGMGKAAAGLLTLLLTMATLAADAQQLKDKYNKQRPVVVVCDWDKPPYEFLNDKGQPAGSNIDVISAVLDQMGLPYKFVMKEWSVALKTFERGRADVVIANGRRYPKTKYAVSENIINYNRVRVAMYSDSVGMVSLKRLERDGAVFKPGDYSAFYFLDEDTMNARKMEFQTPKVALTGLIAGDYKYYIWGEEPLKWKIKELNLEGITLNDVGIPISEVHMIGHDRELIEEMDDQYSRLKQSGEISVLQDKWLHPERNTETQTPTALYISIGALLLVALIYFFNRLARKHVVSATRSSRELNEMMYKALHMGNFKVMQYDIARDRMTNRYGNILPDEGLTLEEFTQRIHPDQRVEFMQKMKRLMEGRERRFELNKRWNAGTEETPEWLNFHGHAISELDNDGRPAYVVNAVHDVTQEVEEDKAAREIIRKYDRLSNIPFVAMSFYSREGWLIDINDQMRKVCGMDEDPETRRFWETVCMFDVPLFRNAYSPDEREDTFFCQHMLYPEMNIDKYIECHVRPLFNADGDIANYYVMTFDISEDQRRDHVRHQQEREIKATKEQTEHFKQRLEFLLTNSDSYLWHSDTRKRMIYFYRKQGQSEVAISIDDYLALLEGEELQRAEQLLDDLKQKKIDSQDIYHCVNHFKHSVFDRNEESWISVTGMPVTDEEGNVVGHTGVCNDITTTVKAKQKLEELTALANDSLRLKSGFMASMTHELRTPLNAIVGFTSVLEALGDSPERGEYVRIIRNSSDMLQRLINDVIDASSFAEGNINIEPQVVDFSAVFDDICMTLRQRVQVPEVTFVKDNPYKSFYTLLDVGRIQQVLTNFVTNAVKFTKEGHIRVGYRYEVKGLYLYCEDTGIGIPKDKQDIVFDRFVKLDEFVQGTGMGLAICKMIAERCKGRIGVDSLGDGQGSTFWVWIPCEHFAADQT